MELLGLSDTTELTISLPASPTDNLSIDLHATSLVVAPPDDEIIGAVPDEVPDEWEAVPSLSDVTTDDEADTGALIGKLWEATEESIILTEEWTPEEPEMATRTRLPWWILGGGAVASCSATHSSIILSHSAAMSGNAVDRSVV